MPGWMGSLLPAPEGQWVVVGWPSDPAAPSSHPPSPPAKLIHGKCSLTSFPRLSQDFSTSCCLLLCQLRAKEGWALQTFLIPVSLLELLEPFKALWILDSTWNFTQSCLGSQGGVLDTGSASWAPSQPQALLLDRLWGEPHRSGDQDWDTSVGCWQHLLEPQWGEISPCSFF